MTSKNDEKTDLLSLADQLQAVIWEKETLPTVSTETRAELLHALSVAEAAIRRVVVEASLGDA